MIFSNAIWFSTCCLTIPMFSSNPRAHLSLICSPGMKYCGDEIMGGSNDTSYIYTCNKKGDDWIASNCSNHGGDSCVTFSERERFNAECITKCIPGHLYCGRQLINMGYGSILNLHSDTLYNCEDWNEVIVNRSCLGACLPSESDSACVQACEPELDYCGHEMNSLEGWGSNFLPNSLYYCNIERSIFLRRNCSETCVSSNKNSFCTLENYSDPDICHSSPSYWRVKRIQDGTEAKSGQWPWMASLRWKGKHICSGTLIGSKWLLTAAHCLEYLLASEVEVVLGSRSVNRYVKGELRLTINKTFIHEKFDDDRLNNDIALLRLKTSGVSTPFIRPLCLSESLINETQDCMIAGWGHTKSGSASSVLRQGKVSIMTPDECATRYRATLSRSSKEISQNVFTDLICAGERNVLYTTACKGDEGGPLMCQDFEGQWYGVGVTTSISLHTCTEVANVYLIPGLYVRISSHSSWIENVTGIKPGMSMHENQRSTGSLAMACCRLFSFVVTLLPILRYYLKEQFV